MEALSFGNNNTNDLTKHIKSIVSLKVGNEQHPILIQYDGIYRSIDNLIETYEEFTSGGFIECWNFNRCHIQKLLYKGKSLIELAKDYDIPIKSTSTLHHKDEQNIVNYYRSTYTEYLFNNEDYKKEFNEVNKYSNTDEFISSLVF